MRMNVSLNEQDCALIDKLDSMLGDSTVSIDTQRALAMTVANRLIVMVAIERIFQNAAKGTVHEDLEVLK